MFGLVRQTSVLSDKCSVFKVNGRCVGHPRVLVGQIIHKLCIDLQDKSSKESTNWKLSQYVLTGQQTCTHEHVYV